MTIDLAEVAKRMVVIELSVAQDPRPEVPLIDVIASLVDLEPSLELEKAALAEVERARALTNGHYATVTGRPHDDPMLLAVVAFLQGVTFARAVQDTKGGNSGAE